MNRLDGRFGLVLAVTALSFNLRLAMSAVSPLMPTIRHDTGLSASAGGLLLTIPFLCFGILAPLAPRLSRRFGAERTITAAIAALIAGILLRSIPDGIAPLFCGTLVMGTALTSGNVLLPVLIKRDFRSHVGVMMGVYATVITAGVAVAAAFSVPLMRATGWGWRATLAFWVTGAVAALIIWLPRVTRGQGGNNLPTDLSRPKARLLYRDRIAWQVTSFFGLQSLVYTAAASWIPSVFVAHGVSRATAGFLLAIVSVTGMVTTFAVPVLAMRRASQGRLVAASVALLAISLAGFLVAPAGGAIAWMLLFGLGQGATYGLALSFILLRSADPQVTAELSGMTQTFGYLLSALGPVGLGVVHDLTGGWAWPLITLLLLLLPLLVFGLAAARERYVLEGESSDLVAVLGVVPPR